MVKKLSYNSKGRRELALMLPPYWKIVNIIITPSAGDQGYQIWFKGISVQEKKIKLYFLINVIVWDNENLISVHSFIVCRVRNNPLHKNSLSTKSAGREISDSCSQRYSDCSSELLETMDTENKRKMIAENRSW